MASAKRSSPALTATGRPAQAGPPTPLTKLGVGPLRCGIVQEAIGTPTSLNAQVRNILVANLELVVSFGDDREFDGAVLQAIRLHNGLNKPPSPTNALLTGSTELALAYIDEIYNILTYFRQYPPGFSSGADWKPELWQAAVSKTFNSHRVKFKFVDGEVWPLDSEELHVEVVEPALRLIHGKPELAAVESAYRSALKEIAADDAADAVTDAGTALQEMLVAMGCTGNALGPLIKDAYKKGLLAAHDSTFADGIEKILHWVSADRSSTGDAHSGGSEDLDDAWFAVHVVGALIVRLAGSPRRRSR